MRQVKLCSYIYNTNNEIVQGVGANKNVTIGLKLNRNSHIESGISVNKYFEISPRPLNPQAKVKVHE